MRKVALMLGAVVAHRGTEQAAVAIGSLPDVHLVVIGEGIAKPAIMAEAAALPHADRIHFLPDIAARRDPGLDGVGGRVAHPDPGDPR